MLTIYNKFMYAILDMCNYCHFQFQYKKSYNDAELLNITFLLGMHCTSQVLHLCMQGIALY